MSLDAILWALKRAPVEDPTAVLVLIALADFAHDDGTVAYPSQKKIAYRARCSDRTVRRHLADLETAGVIRRGDQDHASKLPARHRPVVWDLMLNRIRTDTEPTGHNDRSDTADAPDRTPETGLPRPVVGDSENGVRPDAGGDSDRTPTSDKPSYNPSLTTNPKDESQIADAIPTPPPVRDDVARLCEHLADRIADNGSKRPTITDGWRTAARLMIDRDGRTEEKIHKAIEWCQADEFWRANILSMPKLREKYETLRLQADRANRSRFPGAVATDGPEGRPLSTGERKALQAIEAGRRVAAARAANNTPKDHQPAQIGPS